MRRERISGVTTAIRQRLVRQNGQPQTVTRRARIGGQPVVILDGAKLRWAPPALVTPTIVDVPTGFYSGTFGATEDVVLEFPAANRTSTLSVTGGRNLKAIGGSTVLGSGISGTSVHRFASVAGSVFLEGLLVDANIAAATPNRHDGLDIYGEAYPGPYTLFPDIYLQNMRVVGMNSSSALNHADVLQLQGAAKNVRIDKLTGQSNYQGLFLAPQSPVTSLDLRRVNLAYEAGGDPVTYLLWLLDTGVTPAETPTPTRLRDIWITPRAGQTLRDHAVYPSTGLSDSNGQAVGALTADVGASAFWPAFLQANGVVSKGPRPQGDFVPASAVGWNYLSPGYLGVVPNAYATEVAADGPALYLPLEGNANDASGSGLNGTPTSIGWVTGRHGQGASFTAASTSIISVPDAPSLRMSSSSISIEFWTNFPTAISGFPGVLKKGATDAATTGWQIFAASAGAMIFKRNNLSVQTPNASVVVGKWQHWCFRFNAASNVWVWYCDGRKVASGTQAGFNLANADTSALIIGHGDSAYLQGQVDDVAIYTKVLTTDRVQARAQAT